MKKLFRKLFPSKEMRAYNKMYRRHRKELVKLAKTIREWDYGWLYDSTIMQIRHMYEYYSEGNNIFQSEESLNEILGQLKYVLDLHEELDHLWDDYKFISEEESAKKFEDARTREQELYEEIYSYIGKYIQWWWD